ncbi:MAG: amidohydrolase family protein [Treponema sp.]|jgi:cytosine deaminase|nr:amidohydrolase family protein [Treponema sp.]
MTRYDLLIRNANVHRQGGGLDVAIKDGSIVQIGKNISGAGVSVEAEGKLLSPGFVDSHTHIDKAFVPGDSSSADLISAIAAWKRYEQGLSEEQIYGDILARSRRLLDMAIRSGTTAIKTNVLISPAWKLKALELMARLRDEYRDRIDILTAVPWEKSFEKELDEAASGGAVDFIAGYPTISPDYRADVDAIFRKADQFGLPIDIHVDESDLPDINCFEYVLDKTIKTGMGGRVTCGHVTALSAVGMDEKRAKKAVEKTAEAQVNITTLTSCNMFLMAGNRRGPTRVKEFLDAGVNVAVASDNIRDPFRPFGNADLLEEALLTAQVHKLALPDQLKKVFDMITYNGAKNSLLHNYGIDPGAAADLVLLDAATEHEALVSQARKLLVIKRGKVVYSCRGLNVQEPVIKP